MSYESQLTLSHIIVYAGAIIALFILDYFLKIIRYLLLAYACLWLIIHGVNLIEARYEDSHFVEAVR